MIVLALGLMLATTPAATSPDPLAPALRGMLQCYNPNPERKTCQSIGGYVRNADGGYQNTAVVLVAPNPLITMETASPVVVKAGAVCGKVTPHDLETARFYIAGEPADAGRAEQLRGALSQAFAPILNREVCSLETPGGATQMIQVSVDGVRTPTMDEKMIWVSPSEGYRVAP